MYFFVPKIQEVLNGNQAQHLQACRVQRQDRVWLTDLQGSLALVEIDFIEKKSGQICFNILREEKIARPQPKFILLQALVDKLYLEKLFELLPFVFEQTYLFPSDFSPKQNLPLERLNKILIRSCEQSQKAWKPQVNLCSLPEVAENFFGKQKVFWLETDLKKEGEKQDLRALLEVKNKEKMQSLENLNNSKDLGNSAPICLLVGPEGGWSEKEKARFQELNLPKMSLGNLVYPGWLAGFAAAKQLDVLL